VKLQARRETWPVAGVFRIARGAVTSVEVVVVEVEEDGLIGRGEGCPEARYQEGATTILDLVDAQLSLADAEADMARARYATRTALAALEAILGQRLFSQDAQ